MVKILSYPNSPQDSGLTNHILHHFGKKMKILFNSL